MFIFAIKIAALAVLGFIVLVIYCLLVMAKRSRPPECDEGWPREES
ncbi:MAG: hypothetical protein NTY36_01395 [Deltaproteobacteria bacterium]|nr:hypothetical protein [Deltaproteobacteria bacterium]